MTASGVQQSNHNLAPTPGIPYEKGSVGKGKNDLRSSGAERDLEEYPFRRLSDEAPPNLCQRIADCFRHFCGSKSAKY